MTHYKWNDVHKLDRRVEHDPKSRAYAVSAKGVTYSSVKHHSNVAIFDQGNTGSCTGNATVGAITYDIFFNALPANHLALDENGAIKVYSLATQLDEFTGTYPPDDTGSSGLAAAKAAQQLGLISGYQHAFSLDAALAALMKSPVITGIPWYNDMFYPDATGLVKIGGGVAGGHEVCVDEFDNDKGLVWCRNSWGNEWAIGGRFNMTLATWSQLLNDQGDVTVFVPLNAPAPTPTPVADADQTLVKAMDPWAKGIISTYTQAGKAAAAYKTWKTSKGL